MACDYGIIGLGVIGYGMAKNLRQKLPDTTTLHIYDISDALLKKFSAEFSSHGPIQVESSPKDLASSCGTVFSSLPSGNSVQQVYTDGDSGVINASRNVDRLIIECSTIEIERTQNIGQTIIDAGIGTFVDATVSGGVWGANDGTLSFMVGCADPAQSGEIGSRVHHTLSLVGDKNKIQFCGKLGMGQVAKIAHNYVSLCNNLVATEGMALGLKYGIDKKVLWKCMTDGSANSWVLGLEQPVPGIVDEAPSSNGYKRAFAASLSLKDLGIAVNAARNVGLNPTAGEVALEAFQRVHNDERTRNLDHTSLWLHVNGNIDDYFKSETTVNGCEQ